MADDDDKVLYSLAQDPRPDLLALLARITKPFKNKVILRD
jgi:hypothetical protein